MQTARVLLSAWWRALSGWELNNDSDNLDRRDKYRKTKLKKVVLPLCPPHCYQAAASSRGLIYGLIIIARVGSVCCALINARQFEQDLVYRIKNCTSHHWQRRMMSNFHQHLENNKKIFALKYSSTLFVFIILFQLPTPAMLLVTATWRLSMSKRLAAAAMGGANLAAQWGI